MKHRNFISDTFLLQNKYSEELYFDYARDLPILDYHCHLPPSEIAGDRVYDNISQLWIAGDHYKWRAMRTMGVDEKYITGNASDREKFKAWAEIVPYTLRNPLFHWTHLELKRYFGIDVLLNADSADFVYDSIKEQLKEPENSCRGLLKQMNVEVVCTTDNPSDSLEHHQELAKSDYSVKILPAFRPDSLLGIEKEGFNSEIERLQKLVDFSVQTYADLCRALKKRIDFFDANACKLCDHGLEHFSFKEYRESEIETIFSKKRSGQNLNRIEVEKFKTALLLFLGETYYEYRWVQQFHLGALRNNNTRIFKNLGADSGTDSIGDFGQAVPLSGFLDALDQKNVLAKTILYNLNPADNEVFASMIGNFNDGSIRGKLQFGSGWWFLDQKEGITNQLNSLSNMGLISCFIGMLTDSRSFLSFPRHEYFRRVLCNIFGTEIANGELPHDMGLVGGIVSDICYYNAKEYFKF